MPCALQMTPEQKQIIINIKNHGESDCTVKYIGCNQLTVSRGYKRWREEHTVAQCSRGVADPEKLMKE